MVTGSLARRYARAILQIGIDKGNLDKLGADLRNMAQAMKISAELVSTLTNPGFARADRKRILEALLTRFGATEAIKNLIFLLLDRERLGSLPGISRELDAMIEARAGRVSAEIISAAPLTAAQLHSLTTTLEQLSGKKVQVERREDPDLLGGVIAKVGDVVYDGSLRTQLRSLREELTK